MAKVKFVDTTLRDGHQCLWATRMSTAMMRPIMEPMDRIGFEAIEIMGAVHFDACVRYLKDDPWERIRLFREYVRGPLQVITRSRCALGFELQPLDLHRLWVERLMACGVDRLVAFDGLHDLDNLADGLLHAKSLGAYTIGWLIFSESPIHTDALYASKAREFIERANVDTVMIEDTSGILTPERARTLVPAIKGAIGERPLALHTHNLVGLAQRTCIEAVALGVESLYTCIAPIADGNAPPSVQTTIRNLRHLGHEIDLDDAAIAEVGDWLAQVAERGGFPAGAPNDFDAANFGHQIPGGAEQSRVPGPPLPRSPAVGFPPSARGTTYDCEPRCARSSAGNHGDARLCSCRGAGDADVLEAERYPAIPDKGEALRLGYYGAAAPGGARRARPHRGERLPDHRARAARARAGRGGLEEEVSERERRRAAAPALLSRPCARRPYPRATRGGRRFRRDRASRGGVRRQRAHRGRIDSQGRFPAGAFHHEAVRHGTLRRSADRHRRSSTSAEVSDRRRRIPVRPRRRA